MAAQMSTDFPTVYPPTAPTTTKPCDMDQPDNGWVSNPLDSENRYCYYFDTVSKLSWKDAEEQCAVKGGSLVSIHSNSENGFILSNLKHSDSWLGFNSIYSGDWEWTDHSNVGFLRWAPGGNIVFETLCNICDTQYFSIEPNGNDVLEDCVLIYGETGNWNDRSW